MNEIHFQDIKQGMSAGFSAGVTEEMMEAFLRMSGDTNPLHLNRIYAIEKGFVDRVVYGMLLASLYSRLVGVYLPGKYCLIQGVDIAFHRPVYVGDQLEVRGEVDYINEAYKMIEVRAFIKNQSGVKVSKAKIKCGFHE